MIISLIVPNVYTYGNNTNDDVVLLMTMTTVSIMFTIASALHNIEDNKHDAGNYNDDADSNVSV